MRRELPKLKNPPVAPKVTTMSAEQVKARNEDEFLNDLIKGKKKWADRGEKEYADAYKVLINKFTQLADES